MRLCQKLQRTLLIMLLRPPPQLPRPLPGKRERRISLSSGNDFRWFHDEDLRNSLLGANYTIVIEAIVVSERTA